MLFLGGVHDGLARFARLDGTVRLATLAVKPMASRGRRAASPMRRSSGALKRPSGLRAP